MNQLLRFGMGLLALVSALSLVGCDFLVAPTPFAAPADSADAADDDNPMTDSDPTDGSEFNDQSAVTVTPTTVTATEGGADGSYTVVLNSAPSADVEISISSGDEVTTEPSAITFTSNNWDSPQTITVTAVNDIIPDRIHTDIVAHMVTSTDVEFNEIVIPDVTVTITDDEATITYHVNGASYGTVPQDANVYTVGDTVIALDNTHGLVRNGAVFAGWNTTADGTGDSYVAGTGTFTVTGYTTLYAEWDTSNDGFVGGDGSTGTPYQIATHEHLNNVRTNLGANYVLISDVDLNVRPWNAGPGWDPIGDATTPFIGNLNGNTFAIQNLFRDEGGRFGLFDVVQDANIGNLGLENVSIQNGSFVGPLAAIVEGTSLIRRIYVTGTLQTFQNGGGLVASLNGGTIEESITDVDISITGNPYGGGIAASVGSAGRIRNSYTMGIVDFAFAGVGGFVGRNEGVIETSFSIGAIPNAGNGFLGVELATTNSNFYDQTTSGKSDTTGATPQTTLQMRTLNTFSGAGWNILDAANGTASIWGIVDGSSYPYLNWQPVGTGTRP